MGFARKKDRFFAGYETVSGWLARRSWPMRRAVYRGIGGIFWAAYLFPGNSLRPTMTGLARHAGGTRGATALFRDYVHRLASGTDMAERVRHGYGTELDGALQIPEQARLDALLEKGGLFLALPHLHAALGMTRALAQSYEVLAVVSLTRDKARAEAQRSLYTQIGCEVLDVRSEDAGVVARKILKALRSGKIVAGTVDRIHDAPDEPYNRARDVVRAEAFGEVVGVGAWPTRFTMKAGAPVLPAVVEQTDKGRAMTLHLGADVVPEGDVAEATQVWLSELERLLRQFPEEWQFSLDKHWARVLRRAA